MNLRKYHWAGVILFLMYSCSGGSGNKNVPRVGFLDMLQDETLSQAKKGFFVALKDSGFSPLDSTLEIIYRNAQNDQPTLIQACDYILSQDVDLIATNPTLSTITAIQRTKDVPVFMMVSPRPDIAGLAGKDGSWPANLFGTYETLDYIDTAVMLIHQVMPGVNSLGTIFNQSEPQSMDALKRIETACEKEGIRVEKLPVNSSNETELVVSALLQKKPQVFFALPDNTVFSSMEVIVKTCMTAHVPVFTCEQGLVLRGALAGFGADMYQWGYQTGAQAANYLKTHSTIGLKPEIVKVRRKVYNRQKAMEFGISFDSTFTAVEQSGQ